MTGRTTIHIADIARRTARADARVMLRQRLLGRGEPLAAITNGVRPARASIRLSAARSLPSNGICLSPCR